MDERAIRVRRYAAMILLHWRLIAAVTAVVVAVALAYSLSRPPTYEARSLLLLSGPRFQFDLEPRLRTNLDSFNLGMANARHQTVYEIANGAEVEAAVQHRLADELPPEMLHPDTLRKRINVRSRPGIEYI